MTLADYKIVLYRQLDGAWVAEVPAIGGCYALMNTREAALTELHHVFQVMAEEHEGRGEALPVDTTQIQLRPAALPRHAPASAQSAPASISSSASPSRSSMSTARVSPNG